ncbi:MAG: hypothetical protein ACKPEY_20450 [Planctomycetota bacterium]
MTTTNDPNHQITAPPITRHSQEHNPNQESTFWAITAYFNPANYQRRLSNYHVFRQHLNVPLLTVELGFNGNFQLGTEDADVLIQLPKGDILWQKERLLNVAIEKLPTHVDKVVWLDCDILFERSDWSQQAIAQLDECSLVQAYSEVVRLPEHQTSIAPGDVAGLTGRASICSQLGPTQDLQSLCRTASTLPGRLFPGPIGFGWAFRRALFQNRGFYDVDILGGGDVSFVAALSGCYDIAIQSHGLTAKSKSHYLNWATSLHAEVNQNVRCLDTRIFHLWHGDLTNRKYDSRYRGFDRFQFDPDSDLALNECSTWSWSSPKPDLHRYTAEYFSSRREDG